MKHTPLKPSLKPIADGSIPDAESLQADGNRWRWRPLRPEEEFTMDVIVRAICEGGVDRHVVWEVSAKAGYGVYDEIEQPK